MGSAEEMARQLAQSTGDLSAPPERLEQLARVRRLLASSRLEQPASVQEQKEAQRTVRVVRREDPGAPLGATETLGPFFTAERNPVWFDVFEEAAFTPTLVTAGGGAFLIFAGVLTTSDGLEYDVPAGGVWIRANSLAPGFPAPQYVGLRVASGKWTLSTAALLAGGQITINAATTSVLELDIEQPAGATYFAAPSNVRIDFAGEAATAFQAHTARISANGAVVDVTPAGPATVSADGSLLQFGGGITIISTASADGAGSFQVGGEWQIGSAVWAFSPESQDAMNPALPTESGFAVVQAAAGLTLSWRGGSGPLTLDTATLIAHADSFAITAQSATRGIRQQVRENGQVIGDIVIDTSFPIAIAHNEQPAPESRFQARASVELSVRRPLTADGLPIRVSSPESNFMLSESNGAVRLRLVLRPTPYGTALAISNALLTVEGPSSAGFECGLNADGEVAGGQFFCRFSLKGTLPILPDPYAANFEPKLRPGIDTQIVAGATWAAGEEPAVRIDFRQPGDVAPAWLNSMPQPLNDVLDFNGTHTARREVASSLGRESVSHWLLDVSTNAGQFGVAFGGHRDNPQAAIDQGILHWYGLDTLIFSAPAIQWEPVADSTGTLLSVDDGGPSAFAVDTVRLVPVAPLQAAQELIEAYRAGGFAKAAITLPFGIRALVTSGDPNQAAPFPLFPPRITLDQPGIAEFQSAPRLQFQSTSDTGMPGRANQTNNVFRPGASTNVLDYAAGGAVTTVGQMFNGRFASSVPLHRYDWSGFGASAFSHWVNPALKPPDVCQVHFDVLNGRTSHEVVQVAAILWPCNAVLVRTITLERQNNASVIRRDSGWIASSDGRFASTPDCTFHPGLVKGYTRIREIRDTPRIVTAGGIQFAQVFFDADLEIEGVVRGNRGPSVPVQRHTGYVQFLPIGVVLTAPNLQDLLRQEAPVGGPVDCEIDVGGSGTRMLVSKLICETAIRPPGKPEFVVSLNGMPQFPKPGDWTAVRTRAGQTAAVEPGKGVPVIRQAGQPCRFSEPADLFKAAVPDTQYGFLFSTGSSRLLMPCPEVRPGDRVLSSQFKARLADPCAFATANGLFPKAAASLEFPAPYVLDFDAPVIFDQPAAKRAGELELVSNKVMRLYVEGNTPFDATIKSVDWKVASADQTVFLDLLGYVKLLSVTGKWNAQSDGAKKFDDPVMKLSDQLDQVKEILELLNNLKLPFGMDFSLRVEPAGTLALEASMEGHLAEPDGDRIDTGMGKLGGSLRLGIVIRASISNGVQGFAYIEISGDLQQAIIPGLLYAGGHLRFRAGVFDNGDTQLELTAGTVGSVGGDLIKGLIEIEGTAKYGYTLVVPNNSLEQVRIGVVLGLEVRATLLGGLVGIKFGWEGGALMSLDPPKTHVIITAYISASASVTAAWVFKARRSITVEYTAEVPRGVVLAVLAVTTFGAGAAAGPALLA